MGADLPIHQRLRERRLVAFVVSVTPVADQVDQEVALEAGAILPRETRGFETGCGIVRADVNDRDLESAGEAARVARAVRLAWCGREAELIVRDDVDGAASVVAVESREVERGRPAEWSAFLP